LGALLLSLSIFETFSFFLPKASVWLFDYTGYHWCGTQGLAGFLLFSLPRSPPFSEAISATMLRVIRMALMSALSRPPVDDGSVLEWHVELVAGSGSLPG